MPAISVILPVYNGEEFLAQAITSILGQSEKDFELIISDDASLDQTPAIVQSFADTRIQYIRQDKNLGIFGNLNAGLLKANAPLLQIFCQDDVMLPQCLEKQKAILEAFPQAGMVFCRFHSIDAQGERVLPTYDPNIYSAVPPLILPERSARFFTAFGCLPGNLSTVMLRRKHFMELGKFNEALPYVGDFEYWIRLGKHYPIAFNSEFIMQVRGHQKQSGHVLNKNLELLQQEIPLWISLIQSGFAPEEIAMAENYVLKNRGAQYMHWIVKIMLQGKLAVLQKELSHLQPPFSLLRLLKAYLITCNSRIKPHWREILQG